MHRDEQSAWQAGSYSFLTPPSTEAKEQPPPIFHLSLSSLLSMSSLLLPRLLLLLLPLSLIPPLLFTASLSLPLPVSLLYRGPCFFTCITHNYFHPSIICLLLFSHSTSLSLHYDNNPHYPAHTLFFATSSHLPPLWAAECRPPHTLVLLPLPLLCLPPKLCILHHHHHHHQHQMSLEFGWVYLWKG